MPAPLNREVEFFVYVIESPSDKDLYLGQSESGLLERAIKLNSLHCHTRIAISREAFDASLKIGLWEAMRDTPGRIPIIHISAHGSKGGIGLSNGAFISWADLKELLIPINRALNNALIVCMSCCEGYSGTQMAMFVEENDLPFFAIVGCTGSPVWSETAIAYATFYHWIAKGKNIVEAIEAMKVASDYGTFFGRTGEGARQGFIDYIQRLSAEKVQEQLRSDAAQESGELLQRPRTSYDPIWSAPKTQ